MPHRQIQIILLFVVAALVLFTNLGTARLWDRDEPRNAGCAREMLERNDWVTPMFNDELREQKPVLLYWLIMSAYSVFGVSEFSARFWSAALALGSVMLTYAMGRRLHSHQAGFWSALSLSTCLMFVVAGRAATPDSVLIFCGSAALTFFVYGTFAPREEFETRSKTLGNEDGQSSLAHEATIRLKHGKPFPQQWQFVIGMYGCMALAVLAKGPVGVVLPTAVIGMFCLLVRLPGEGRIQREELGMIARVINAITRTFSPKHFLATVWSMRPLTAIAIVLAVAAPWYVWVGLRTEGDFLAGFFLKEHFGRATTSFENHSGPIYYYPIAMLVGFFPWSIFAVPALLTWDRIVSKRGNFQSRLPFVFMACWVGVYVGVFTIAQTKLPSYVTPCYPALALLTGCFLADRDWSEVRTIVFWTRSAFAVFALVGVGLTVGLPMLAREYFPGLEWLGALGLILTVAGVAGFWMCVIRRFELARFAVGASAVAFALCLFGIGTVWVDRYQESDRLFAAMKSHQNSDSPDVASIGVLESSWVFYSHRPIFEIEMNGTHGSDSLAQDTDRFQRDDFWDRKLRPGLVEFLEHSDDPFLITRSEEVARLKEVLPDDFEVLARAKYFLKNEELVLLGRAKPSAPSVADNGNDRLR